MRALNVGADLRVTGWGELWYGGDQSSDLQQALVPLGDASSCRGEYPHAIDENMICAGLGEGGRDACRGDSGGPLVAEMAGAPVLVGVVSFGRGCGRAHALGVYTRVSSFRSWIIACIAAHESEAPSSSAWQAVRCNRLPRSEEASPAH